MSDGAEANPDATWMLGQVASTHREASGYLPNYQLQDTEHRMSHTKLYSLVTVAVSVMDVKEWEIQVSVIYATFMQSVEHA